MGQLPPARRPSIYDVARLAGVSYQTVSRVINRAPKVSDRSRTAVLAAIAELDFHPSSAARAFSTGKGHDIAVITTDLESYGWAAMLTGIQQRARELGRSVLLHELQGPAETLSWLKSQTPHARIVLGSSEDSRRLIQQIPIEERVVGIGDRDMPGRDWVSFTEFTGARDAVNHLLRLGHWTVDFITIRQLRATGREDGWRETLMSMGAMGQLHEIGSTPEDAYQTGLLLGQNPQITAILCANDQIAIPVLAGIRAAGKSVPTDVSVIGFDDHPLAAYAYPSLTTVKQDFLAIGRRGVDMFEGERSSRPTTIHLPAELVIRASTAPRNPDSRKSTS